mgnify:CR=1 FL=1
MFKSLKTIKFFISLYLFLNIFPSISQTNEDVPLNNIVLHESPKLISTVVFEDFLGNEVNLNDYYGKLIIINFWATWCAPCRMEIPDFNEVYKENKEDLEILGISISDNRASLENFVKFCSYC